jgi:hypothetical protein
MELSVPQPPASGTAMGSRSLHGAGMQIASLSGVNELSDMHDPEQDDAQLVFQWALGRFGFRTYVK